MNNRLVERELKFDATGISHSKFLEYGASLKPDKYLLMTRTDYYFEQGPNVVRFRTGEGEDTLTVKKRKSADSTLDRIEINLNLKGNKSSAILSFLECSGWKQTLKLNRMDHVFWFKSGEYHFCLSFYYVDAGGCSEVMKFLELELEPQDVNGKFINGEEATKELKLWEDALKESLSLGSPVNQSIWEIYSGKQYLVQEDKHA